MTWHKNILEWFYLGNKYYIAMLKKVQGVNLVGKNTGIVKVNRIIKR